MHGQGGDKYEKCSPGYDWSFGRIAGCYTNSKIRIFPDELKARQQMASTYEKLISSSPLNLKTPIVPSGYSSAWAQYSVLADDKKERHRLIERLKGAGIPTTDLLYKTSAFAKSFIIFELQARRLSN